MTWGIFFFLPVVKEFGFLLTPNLLYILVNIVIITLQKINRLFKKKTSTSSRVYGSVFLLRAGVFIVFQWPKKQSDYCQNFISNIKKI